MTMWKILVGLFFLVSASAKGKIGDAYDNLATASSPKTFDLGGGGGGGSGGLQSRSGGSGGGFGQPPPPPSRGGAYGAAGSSYTRPVVSNSYSASTPVNNKQQIKILPLPIPVGLPIPTYGGSSGGYGGGYGVSGGGGGGYGASLSHGLFAGFGGPLGPLLLKEKALGLGNDPVKASILAGKANPLIHLLSAPYLKNVRENNGRDLPSIDDFQELLQRSTFGLSDIDRSRR